MVQPEVIEDKSTSYIIGKVDNPKKEHKREFGDEADLRVYQESSEQE